MFTKRKKKKRLSDRLAKLVTGTSQMPNVEWGKYTEQSSPGAAIQENRWSLQAWKTWSLLCVLPNSKVYQLHLVLEETAISTSPSFLVNTNPHKQRWDARFCSDYTEILVSTERGENCIRPVLSPSRAWNHHEQLWKELPRVTGSWICYVHVSCLEKAPSSFFKWPHYVQWTVFITLTRSASIPVTFSAESVKTTIFINTLQSPSNRVRS